MNSKFPRHIRNNELRFESIAQTLVQQEFRLLHILVSVFHGGIVVQVVVFSKDLHFPNTFVVDKLV